jgi:hypothetical protein
MTRLEDAVKALELIASGCEDPAAVATTALNWIRLPGRPVEPGEVITAMLDAEPMRTMLADAMARAYAAPAKRFRERIGTPVK